MLARDPAHGGGYDPVMVLRATASTLVRATPQQVMELVLDLERYRQVDSKIVSVGEVTGPDENGQGHVRVWSRLKWTPPIPDAQIFVLERWSRLTFKGAPGQLGRLMFSFSGTIACEPSSDGTLVTHSYELAFRGPFRIFEVLHRDWLQRDLDDEMSRLSRLLDH